MRRLSSIILVLLLTVNLSAQKSPHGDSFTANCDDCHKTDGWKVDLKTIDFNHNGTTFPLVGQHRDVNCKECHTSLEFAKAPLECFACHTDVHEQTVGNACARCHTPVSWVVNNISQLHHQSRFPLIGAHTQADCKDCHKNLIPSTPSASTASRLRFDPMGIECYDCHKSNFQSATQPNHVEGKYSTNCIDCHKINTLSWNGAGITHDFFPLEGGHAISDCKRCHTSGSYSKIPAECNSCHQSDYTSALNPNHTSLGFPSNCALCHTTTPGWKPAEYKSHDALFPIYSGKHKGEWNTCADCHKNTANYQQYICTDCHEHNKGDTDNEHKNVTGYIYNSEACFACHPTGTSEGSFDHNKSVFPLTGAHTTTACADCHTSGYAGTPNACASCHTTNYNQSTNPNHKTNGIANDCATCHTTAPGWKPATYPVHSNLSGVHIPIANDCAKCHNGSYLVIPKICSDCHTPDYNQATNPNHITSQFSKTCETCHSQTAWVPSTFNHNNTYPLTGAHAAIASNCTQCHPNGYANTPNTCAGCHQPDYNQSVNPNHSALNIPNSCATCHTTNPGWQPATFAIHNNYYVLAGAHIQVACVTCHNGNYTNTPNTCAGCHMTDYNQTTNPKHATAQFPVTCADCHSQSAWTPSTFNHDGQYFPIYSGKHKGKWNSCADCHTNPSNYVVYTCTTSCHPQSSMNSKHQGVSGYQYVSTACLNCHPNGSGGKMFDNSNFDRN